MVRPLSPRSVRVAFFDGIRSGLLVEQAGAGESRTAGSGVSKPSNRACRMRGGIGCRPGKSTRYTLVTARNIFAEELISEGWSGPDLDYVERHARGVGRLVYNGGAISGQDVDSLIALLGDPTAFLNTRTERLNHVSLIRTIVTKALLVQARRTDDGELVRRRLGPGRGIAHPPQATTRRQSDMIFYMRDSVRIAQITPHGDHTTLYVAAPEHSGVARVLAGNGEVYGVKVATILFEDTGEVAQYEITKLSVVSK
jgi:hypothetical protein